ncbi:hypothetical protein CJD36_014070 [Flavipsychrobacter stenotrophus]|uniref:Uncharacterized protein n=1 Tax=Flavipsychrobacter stenotrophus TaxID=2077091 RepID=A0A2S7SVY0_9BACT|nr:hypothetical protein [Flavipsychrobacter stenotrophus]PQJ11090.1 hypothetical protein CJD36_014070 [Flavipsychrobacter stenotrophus]
MKHFFFLLISFSITFCSKAQFNYIHGLPYKVDTFRLNGLQCAKQRYAQRDLDGVRDENIQERILAANIRYLQGSLDQMNSYIIEGKDVYYNVGSGEGHIRDIKNTDPTFDCTNYTNELQLYKKIADDRFEIKEEQEKQVQFEKDEIVRKQQEEKKRVDDSIAEEEAYIHHLVDSISDALEAKKAKIAAKEILKKYGPVNGKAINNGKVLLGMTPAMCELAWGMPLGTSKSTTAKGTTEKWIYTKFQYLVFTNGRVSAIYEGGVVEY